MGAEGARRLLAAVVALGSVGFGALVGPAGQAAAATWAAPVPERPPGAVGTATQVVIDGARSTTRAWNGRLHRLRGRRIALTLWYPASGVTADGRDDGRDHAGAEVAPGPFPLVVFAPGFDVTPLTYERTLHAWAAAGYVVVAALFPGSGPVGRGQPTEADLVQQPRDLSEAIDAVARDAVTVGGPFAGRVDLSRIAVAGHSDGGSTVVRMVLSTAYADPRVDAAIVLSGARLGGAYTRRHTVPLLLVSGDDDQYNSRRVFARVFAAAHGPRAWVDVRGGRHLAPYVASGGQPQTLRELEVAWLDVWLGGADERAEFLALARRRGVTHLVGGGL